MEIHDRLQTLPLFAGLDEEQLNTVAKLAEPREVGEGTVLVGVGAHGYFFFVIEDGSAEVRQDGAAVGQMGPGEFFGEIAILDPGGRRTASVVAGTPMRVLAFFGADYHAIEAVAPQVGERVRDEMRRRLDAVSS
jgi:CRP-like cAMP-binding protein